MLLSYISLAAAILLGIAGQIVLKAGAVNATGLAAQLVSPLTILGLGIYGCAGIAYVVALNKIPVSVAFPSVAASYAIVALLAHFLWNEPLGWPQLGGIALIAGGIVLIHHG